MKLQKIFALHAFTFASPMTDSAALGPKINSLVIKLNAKRG
jgi:hypothetical protein